MNRIGSSDAAAIAGLSKYSNPTDVFNRVVRGMSPVKTKDMERGNVCEPIILTHAGRMGIELEDRDNQIRIPHPVYDFAHAQVDGLGSWEGQPIVVEAKSVGPWAKGWGAPDTSDVPERYRAQVIWQLACTDLQLGLLLAGFGAEDEAGEFTITNVVRYQIERDQEFEAFLFAVCGEFWREHCLTGIPPNGKALQRYPKEAA